MPIRQPIEAWLEKPEPIPSTSSDTVIEMEPLPSRSSELDIFVIHRRAKPISSSANSDQATHGPYREMDIIGRVPSPSISESSLVTLDLDFESCPPRDDEGLGNPSVGASANIDHSETIRQSQHSLSLTDEESHAVVDEEQKRKAFWTRVYLLMTLRVMFYLGMTPRNPEGSKNKTLGKWCFSMLIRIFILAVALLEGFVFIKRSFIWDRDEGIVIYGITMGYAANNILMRVVFWGTLWWYASDIFRLLELLTNIFVTDKDNTMDTSYTTMVTFMLMIGTSVGDAIIAPFITYLAYPPERNSVLKFLSFRWSVSFFVWQTEYDYHAQEAMYGSNITVTTATIATVGASISVAGNLQENLINDVGLSISITMLGLSGVLIQMLKTDRSQRMNASRKIKRAYRTKIWNSYRQIRRASMLFNKIFGWFLFFLQADNLLFCAYFLFDSIIGGEHEYVILRQVVFIIKLTCFYALAAKAFDVNAIFRTWIRTTYRITDVVYVEGDVDVLALSALDTLSTDPVGIGSGLLLMTKEFFAKFYGGVGSCFLLLLDSVDKFLPDTS